MTNLNSKIPIYLYTGLFLLNLGFADPFKDLNIDFLLNDSTKTLLKKPLKSKKKDDKKADDLVKLFKDNFAKYESFGDYAEAGPV